MYVSSVVCIFLCPNIFCSAFGCILKLSDKSIQNIMDLQYLCLADFIYPKKAFKKENQISPRTFNLFIENFEKLQDFTFLLNTLIGLIRIYDDLDIFLTLFDLQFYIVDCLSNGNSLKGLTKILGTKIEDILLITRNGNNNICVGEEDFLELNDCCDDLKNYFNLYDIKSKTNLIKDNKLITDSELFGILNDILEVSISCKHIIYKEINYTKYELNKLFSDFFDSLGAKSFEAIVQVPKELSNFKKRNDLIQNRINLDINKKENSSDIGN